MKHIIERPEYEPAVRSLEVDQEFAYRLKEIAQVAFHGAHTKIGIYSLTFGDLEKLIVGHIDALEAARQARNKEMRDAYYSELLELDGGHYDSLLIPGVIGQLESRLMWGLDPLTGKKPVGSPGDAQPQDPSSPAESKDG